MNAETRRPPEPVKIYPLATALASRAFKSIERNQKLLKDHGLLDESSDEIPPSRKILYFKITELVYNKMLKFIYSGKKIQLDPAFAVDQAYADLDEETIDKYVSQLKEEEKKEGFGDDEPIDRDSLVHFWREVDVSLAKTLVPASDLNVLRQRILLAEELAKEKEVSITKVFEEDELSDELERREMSSELYARSALFRMDLVSRESYIDHGFEVKHGTEALQIDGLDEHDGIGEMMVEHALLDDRIEAMREDPEEQAKIGQDFEDYKRATLLIIKNDLRRLWGQEAIDALPEDIRARLVNSDTSTN